MTYKQNEIIFQNCSQSEAVNGNFTSDFYNITNLNKNKHNEDINIDCFRKVNLVSRLSNYSERPKISKNGDIRFTSKQGVKKIKQKGIGGGDFGNNDFDDNFNQNTKPTPQKTLEPTFQTTPQKTFNSTPKITPQTTPQETLEPTFQPTPDRTYKTSHSRMFTIGALRKEGSLSKAIAAISQVFLSNGQGF